jgi:hypothetical protein
VSIAALNWAFAVPVEGPVKAVLVALANHANEACECWPNQERIALHSGFADRTVRKAITELERLGLVVNGPSFYVIRVGVDIEKPAPRAARKARANRHLVPTSGTACQPIRHLVPAKPAPRAAPIENHQEPPKEPPVNHQRQTAMIMPIAGGKASAPSASLPPWLPREAWDGFVESRKKLRKPLTDRAVMLILKQLAAFRQRGVDIEAAINQSVMNSWQGIFEPKDRGANAPRLSAAQEARASHFRRPDNYEDGITIDGTLDREYG